MIDDSRCRQKKEKKNRPRDGALVDRMVYQLGAHQSWSFM